MSFVSACLTTLYYRGNIKVEKMSFGIKLYWFMYNNVATFACFITVFYWTLVYEGIPINLNNVLVHMTNSIGPIIDLMIVNHPYHIFQCINPMISLAIYTVFTYAYQILGGLNENGENFIYSALNWSQNPKESLILSMIAISLIGIIHIMLCVWQSFRIFLFKSLQGKKLQNVESTHVEI